MAKKAVILDCDGLIVDSEAVYTIVMQETLKKLNVNVSEELLSHQIAGLPFDKGVLEVEGLYNVSLGSNAVEQWLNKANIIFENDLQGCKGVKLFLEYYTGKLAVASGSPLDIIKVKLKAANLNDFIKDSVIFSGVDVENPKPAPDVYLAAAAGIGEKPEDCIAVEDSASGVKAGKAAGMYTVGCLGGSHIFNKQEHRLKLLDAGADIVINDMSELKQVIEELM